MKKLLLLGVVMMGVLSSCVKDAASGPVDYQKAKEEAYSNAFVQAFGGKIAANQTWGFAQSMRAAYPNGNKWADEGYTVPADITAEELEKVHAVFDLKGDEKYESKIDWNDFFVQQVYKGEAEYTAGNGGKVVGSDKMNYLVTVTNRSIKVVNYNPYETEVVIGESYDDHMFDFNGSNSSDYGGRMLMLNSNTKEFGFHNSEDSKMHYNFRMEEIDGNYYVGFDFEGTGENPNQQVARDYIYNDWIVKIVPAKGTPDKVKEEGLIICEDLGTIGDFDFNDVVFYAKVWESGMTEITLLAAGGTLNLTVAGHEVHEAFGVGQTTMVNTEESTSKGAKKDPFYFVAENTYSSLIEIPVVVRTKDAAGNVTSYELSAEMGKAPQKICVPKGFKWCKEYKSLAEVYPGFKSWTTGAADTWTGSFDAENVCDYEFAY